VNLLLDTSAVVCIVEKESGWLVAREKVSEFDKVLISALTIAEYARRCLSRGDSVAQAKLAVEGVLIMVDEVIAVDQQIALRMLNVVAHSTSRVPTIDAIIAATAIQHGAVLLHRDAHFRGIPQTMLHQEELPAPNSGEAPNSINAPNRLKPRKAHEIRR
jgi:predicted nucleic acid-binding protein